MAITKPLKQVLVENLGNLLSSLSTANGYRLDWDRVVYWQDLPTEYNKNWLTFKDIFTEFTDANRHDEHRQTIEIQGFVFGEDPATLGIMAEADIIEVLGTNQTLGGISRILQLKSSEKECETGGRKVCLVTLTIEVLFKTKSFAAV